MSLEARGGEDSRPGGDLNTRGEGEAVGNAQWREQSGAETQVGGGQPEAEGAAEQMRKPARTPAQEEAATAPTQAVGTPLRPGEPAFPPTLRRGAAEPGPAPPPPPLCGDPGRRRGGRGRQGRAEGARERAARPRPAAPPSFPARRALCSCPGSGARGGGPACGGVSAGGRGRRGTYVSLWSSARRSLGTLRRWDSRLRSPSTVSSGGTDRS